MIVGTLFFIILVITLIMRFINSARRARMKKRKRYKKRSENKRYNYRKRSENRRRRNPDGELTPRDMYMQPIYKELQKRSADASGSADKGYYDEDYEEDYDTGFEEEYDKEYDEDYQEDYEDRIYDEEQMVKDFPGMKGYGIELLPLDHPNRWDM